MSSRADRAAYGSDVSFVTLLTSICTSFHLGSVEKSTDRSTSAHASSIHYFVYVLVTDTCNEPPPQFVWN
jgi:hypothetical protein